jgi:hypothetical protein
VSARILLDPTGERAAPTRERSPRPASLDGRTNALRDIDEQLAGRGLQVRRYSKPTFSKPAPIDLRHEIGTQCDVVIEALAD